MQLKHLTLTIGLTAALFLPAHFSAAAKNHHRKATEKSFIMKAANGGMTEVELGNIAAEKGTSAEVKDFGKRMVTDHSKANDQLKEVASKMGVTVPAKVDAKHRAMIDKISSQSGAAFDQAYVAAMIKAHKMDIAEFEAADKQVKNADLKTFIEETVPVMKEHLSMIEKMNQTK